MEIGRVITSGITIIQEGRIKLSRVLADLGHNKPVPYPDIQTKEKAQKFIGLDVDKLNMEKESFKKSILQDWLKKAEEKESKKEIKYI